LAPDFEFLWAEPKFIGQLRERVPEAMRIGIGQPSIGESFFENLPDRGGVAPMLSRQSNDLELPIGDKSCNGFQGGCREEYVEWCKATSPTLITARIGQPIRTTARSLWPPNKRPLAPVEVPGAAVPGQTARRQWTSNSGLTKCSMVDEQT
jgi:hypothetical protein